MKYGTCPAAISSEFFVDVNIKRKRNFVIIYRFLFKEKVEKKSVGVFYYFHWFETTDALNDRKDIEIFTIADLHKQKKKKKSVNFLSNKNQFIINQDILTENEKVFIYLF